uniref:DUF3730 domain-containing protein n=1 Tax=Syphacia muris TaxID=451379 RepID=A0A0N5AAY6_9BILA
IIIITFIVPFLVALSSDAAWEVRKLCCETFVTISRICSMHTRVTELAPCFVLLLNDKCPAVSVFGISYRKLGQFIVLFAGSTDEIIPKDLLDTYRRVVFNCCTNESDISQHCAYNFPAVAYTLGRDNWLHIKDTYIQLVSDGQRHVRQSLASSIHEIAAIIGEENTDKYLVPVFWQFINDVEDVKFGVLKHLYDFFRVFSKEMRHSLVAVLATLLYSDSDNDKNWRLRYEYTWQCIFLCDLYDVEEINTYIAAIALTLANDRIACVRKVASYLLSVILVYFWTNSENENCVSYSSMITLAFIKDILKGFYLLATVLNIFFHSIVLLYSFFVYFLVKKATWVVFIAVPNIRLAFLCALSSPRGRAWFLDDCDGLVRKAVLALTKDSEIDCRRAARLALGCFDSECYIEVSFLAALYYLLVTYLNSYNFLIVGEIIRIF